MGTARGARTRRRAHTRAGARDRIPPPRRRRLVREHDRPHHVAAGRSLPREPVGPVVGRGPRHAISSPSTPTARSSTASGTSPRPCTSTPSCTAADPTPRSSCTTTRRTRRRSPPSASCPNLVHQNSSILADELVLVNDYDGEVDKPTLGAELAEHIGDASVALLVSHGVIVTAPTIEEAVYKSVLFERTCMLALARAGDGPLAHPDRADAPEAAEGVAGRTGRARVLARRRAYARARRTRRLGVAMAIPLEELQAKQGFTTATAGEVTWLPEPERAEPAVHGDLGRRPHRRAARRVRGTAPGEARRRARRTSSSATTAARPGSSRARSCRTSASTRSSAGRSTEYSFEPTRFDEMRRGAWDIRARIADMDLNGVYASVCFPSFLPGFAGQRLQQLTDDPELALACVRAWNDWVIEDWAGVRAGTHDPAADPVPARSRGRRGRRCAATRRAGSRR